MVEQGLQTRQQEHQKGKEVTLPQGGIFIPHKAEQQAEEQETDIVMIY